METEQHPGGAPRPPQPGAPGGNNGYQAATAAPGEPAAPSAAPAAEPGRPQHYSIPGILHYIQHEWARFSMERARWEVERSELQVSARRGLG
ncbi:hypothetical protein NDU88_000556 [Pleurodeles waltl]|uniref:Striatin N-terminal domain-containing protein n=1 Tax=Pleurodeles waltl TaxID=8319 RepID=A0AAV7MME4_PLEWA|nr:hypothetical protein NDU88_000556 [Pleurodeles waltl]